MSKTFLTLSQMKYLNAETQRTAVQAQAAQEAAARQQTTFGEQGAAGQYLSSVGQAPPSSPAGPGQPPAPGAPPAPGGAVDLTHPTILAGIRAIAPHAAEDIIKGLYDRADQATGLKQKQLDLAKSTLDVGAKVASAAVDEPSYQLALGLVKELGGNVAALPQHYTPQAAAYLGEVTRTAQQRVEEGQKNFEQQTQRMQAQAAQSQAKTAQQLADRGYPLGTGYGQDPNAKPPRILGPQGDATQAPISPEGMALKNGYTQRFETGSQDFKASTAAYNEVVPALKQATNTGDLVALRAFSKLSLPSQAVRGAGSNAPMGNILEQVEGEISRLVTDKGATIAPALRTKLLETAKVLHAQQIDTHLQFRDQIRTEASGQLGSGAALEVAPNRITTLGSSGKPMSQAAFDAYLKAHPGVTRGRALLDLASGQDPTGKATQIYYVRGGPQ
jgi:hypothetical protein